MTLVNSITARSSSSGGGGRSIPRRSGALRGLSSRLSSAERARRLLTTDLVPIQAPALGSPPTTGDLNQPWYRFETVSQLRFVDWRASRYRTGLLLQDGCESCWALAATDLLSMLWALAFNATAPVPLAPQQVCDCGTGSCCRGGWPEWVFLYAMSNGGVAREIDYPYTAMDGRCPTRCPFHHHLFLPQLSHFPPRPSPSAFRLPPLCCPQGSVIGARTDGAMTCVLGTFQSGLQTYTVAAGDTCEVRRATPLSFPLRLRFSPLYPLPFLLPLPHSPLPFSPHLHPIFYSLTPPIHFSLLYFLKQPRPLSSPLPPLPPLFAFLPAPSPPHFLERIHTLLPLSSLPSSLPPSLPSPSPHLLPFLPLLPPFQSLASAFNITPTSLEARNSFIDCSSLARAFNITPASLEARNPFVDCSIQPLTPGYILIVAGDTNVTFGCAAVDLISPNDTCTAIATRNNVTVKVLQALNPGVNCSLPAPSPSLRVSSTVCVRSGMLSTTAPAAVSCGQTYRVQPGDTCMNVALNASITLTRLLLAEMRHHGPSSPLNAALRGTANSGAGLRCTTTAPLDPSMLLCVAPLTVELVSVECAEWYSVTQADTCSRIANAALLSMDDFMKLNPGLRCDPPYFQIGQQVCVAGAIDAFSADSLSSDVIPYTVIANDTLASISNLPWPHVFKASHRHYLHFHSTVSPSPLAVH
ncbi:unnamed protein product [Closterium sp. NIES-65]|nr:unnamed protein product [Closterium sp. NIES-65]